MRNHMNGHLARGPDEAELAQFARLRERFTEHYIFYDVNQGRGVRLRGPKQDDAWSEAAHSHY